MNRHFADILGTWQEAQRVFWTAAASRPAFQDADAFAPPDWQAFDGFVATLMEEALPRAEAADLTRAHAAAAAYRDVIAAAWSRIREDFEAQRRALWDPAALRPTGPSCATAGSRPPRPSSSARSGAGNS